LSKAVTDRFRLVGQFLLLVATVRVVTALALPDPAAPLDGEMLFASTFLLIVHAVFYHFGERFRSSKKGGIVGYLGIQATLAAAISLYSRSIWIAATLFAMVGAQAFTLFAATLGRRGRSRTM
jgi:hypothetical protein